MKKIASLGIILSGLFLFSLAWASDKEKPPNSITINAEVAVYTSYVAMFSGETVFDKPVAQQGLTLTHQKTGLYANIWNSWSFADGYNSDPGDEIDYMVGITREVGGINFNLYYSYFNLYPLQRHNNEDVHVFGLRAEFLPIWKIKFYLAGEYNLLRETVSRSGFFWRVGGIREWNDLKIDLSLAGHEAIRGGQAEVISSARLGLSYDWKIKKWLSVVPEIYFQKKIGEKAGENNLLIEDKIWGGLKLVFSF